MPSRLRSNFSRKIHKYKNRKHITRRLKKRKSRSMKAISKSTKYRSKSTKGHRHIQKGGNVNTKKYEGFDFYGNRINEVAVSSPMQWDD
jgi:hypothetical protein